MGGGLNMSLHSINQLIVECLIAPPPQFDLIVGQEYALDLQQNMSCKQIMMDLPLTLCCYHNRQAAANTYLLI